MTLSDLSNLGTFVSAIGVLASLIFVGIQLRQNTGAKRDAASRAHVSSLNELLVPVVENGEVANLWRRGLTGMKNLNNDERVRFIIMAGSIYRYAECARLQWLHGHLEVAHWNFLERIHTEIANQPGMRDYWAIRGSWYAADFQAWHDNLPVYETTPIYGAEESA